MTNPKAGLHEEVKEQQLKIAFLQYWQTEESDSIQQASLTLKSGCATWKQHWKQTYFCEQSAV